MVAPPLRLFPLQAEFIPVRIVSAFIGRSEVLLLRALAHALLLLFRGINLLNKNRKVFLVDI